MESDLKSREREPVRLYQPIWVKGRVNDYYRYQRECEDRYEVVRSLAKRFKRPFSVLDVGSNYGYFPIRLMEEFDCCCVLIDDKEVEPVLRENRMLDRSVVVKRKVTGNELEALSKCESFDIVLGLSVLHHLPDYEVAYAALCRLGWWSIFEIPGEDDLGAAYPERHKGLRDLFGEPDGYFKSHLGERPYFILENPPSIEEQTIDAADRDAPGYSRYEVRCDFEKSTFLKDGKEREFIPGMNLYNFQRLGGGWPTKDIVESELEQYKSHPDFKPWNFILGRQITPIDQERK